MPVIQELHSFSSTIGGYTCLNCTAFITDLTFAANIPTQASIEDGEALSADGNGVLNLAYKKSGLA